MLLLALALAQAPVHVAPPKAEGHVHPAPTLKVCPVTPVIPPELAGWRTPVAVAAARNPVAIPVGKGVRARLLLIGDVVFPVAPARRGDRASHGGVFAFEVARGGRYRVALGARPWIEVVQGGRIIPSAAHAHGPECSPVMKMVDYDLTPGRYLLEVAGSPPATLGMMVARVG